MWPQNSTNREFRVQTIVDYALGAEKWYPNLYADHLQEGELYEALTQIRERYKMLEKENEDLDNQLWGMV